MLLSGFCSVIQVLPMSSSGNYVESARAFILAVQLCPADPRALQFLEQLFGSHPEVEAEIPDIFSQIEECREAVRMAFRQGGEA